MHYVINDYLIFDFNWPAVATILYMAYYLMLEPIAAVSTYTQPAQLLLPAETFFQS